MLRVPAGQLSHFRDDGDVQRLKDAADIVRIIGEHVALKPKGREYVGLCPFHDDRSPSMSVSPTKQIYKCFSCGAGGDVLTFVQKFHRLEFRETLEYLSQRTGVPLTPRRPRGDGAAPPSGTAKEDLLRASAFAGEFFRALLAHEQHGQGGRTVIEKRRISPEMVREFQLGVAPDRWDGLLATLRSRGMGPEAFAAAGLLKRRESDAGYYDSFRHRLMFPIWDQMGRVVAFGARKIRDEDEPKYLNSSESPIFEKGKTLYALHLAAPAIREEKTALICEGYTDVIACHQAGVRTAVATLGTALTRDHARVLRRLCERVVLLFDGDDAGQRAADRAAEVFFAEPIEVGVVTLSRFTDAKDPDELTKREGGVAIFRQALEKPVDVLAYRMRRIQQRLSGATPAALARAINEEVEQLAALGLSGVEPVRKALIVQQLARLAGVREEDVRAIIPSGRPVRARAVDRDDAAPSPTPRAPIHTRALDIAHTMLGCVLCDGALWTTLGEADKDDLAPAVFSDPAVRELARVVHAIGEDGELPSLTLVLPALGRAGDADEASGDVWDAPHAPQPRSGGSAQSSPDDAPDAHATAVHLMARIDEQCGGDRERVHALWRECLARVRRERALRSPTPSDEAPGASGPGLSDFQARIAALRRGHEQLGPDRRIVPKPLPPVVAPSSRPVRPLSGPEEQGGPPARG